MEGEQTVLANGNSTHDLNTVAAAVQTLGLAVWQPLDANPLHWFSSHPAAK